MIGSRSAHRMALVPPSFWHEVCEVREVCHDSWSFNLSVLLTVWSLEPITVAIGGRSISVYSSH